MKKIILLMIIALAGISARGQSGTPVTVCSGSLWFIGIDYSWAGTIGEAFTATLDGSDFQLTQGFHQPEKTVFGIDDVFDIEALRIFPNPATDHVNIHLLGNELPDQVKVTMTDLSGRNVLTRETSPSSTIRVGHLRPGFYILNISYQSESISSIKISKL